MGDPQVGKSKWNNQIKLGKQAARLARQELDRLAHLTNGTAPANRALAKIALQISALHEVLDELKRIGDLAKGE